MIIFFSHRIFKLGLPFWLILIFSILGVLLLLSPFAIWLFLRNLKKKTTIKKENIDNYLDNLPKENEIDVDSIKIYDTEIYVAPVGKREN